MRTSGGQIFTQEDLMYQACANTSPIFKVSPEVPEFMKTQMLPVEVFNKVMSARGDQEVSDTDDALFGTHLREAARVLRSLIH
jgi:hypothetical protein